jgi:two-component system, chemotaxis family, response regulator Rcp1
MGRGVAVVSVTLQRLTVARRTITETSYELCSHTKCNGERASEMKPVVYHILVAEDNPADVRLIQEGFRDFEEPYQIHSVRDGAAAIRFLSRQGEYADAPRPNLVLLDLNMPGMNGHEVLQWMRSDPSLETIPVIVLSSSVSHVDVELAYRLRANSYLRKSQDLDQFMMALDGVKSFWLKRAVIPVSY